MTAADRWLSRLLWGAAALFIGAVGLTAATLLQTQHDEALANNKARLTRFISGAEAAINRSFLGIDLLLAGLAEPLGEALPDPPLGTAHSLRAAAPPVHAANRLLQQVVRQNLQLRDVLLLAPDGRVLAAGQASSLRLGLTLPAGFITQVLAQTVPALTISPPSVNPATAEAALYFARPVALGSGRAVLLAEVPVALVAGIAAQSIDIAGMTVTLERSDGQLLASAPAAPHAAARLLRPPQALPAVAATGQVWQGPGRLQPAKAMLMTRPTLYPGVLLVVGLQLDVAQLGGARQRHLVLAVAIGFSAMLLLAAALGDAQLRRLRRARSALAASKATLDQALASMNDGLLLLDADDRIVVWNRRYLDLFPWLATVARVGLPFSALTQVAAAHILPSGTEQARQAWVTHRLAMRNDGGLPFAQQVTSGLVVHTTEHRTADGGLVCVYRDITSNERTLADAVAAAEAATEAKSRFLATMSHEMRTPLNGVLGMIGLLLRSPLTAAQQHQAELVRSSGQSLLALLNDILDLSKIEAGRMTLQIAPFALAQTVQDVVSLLAERAAAQGLALHLVLPPDLPPVLCGDASRLRQVLFNLVGNAIKFTEAGEVIVRLAQRPLQGDQQGKIGLTILVQDTGIGIAAADLPRLFTRFTQADDSSARRYGGSGLGLAITREIVELMGGEVSVTSAPGLGSSFMVDLTLAPGMLPSAAPDQSARPGPAAVVGLRILVAEDNPVNQLVTKALLDHAGHHCDVVGNGLDALRQVQASRYDLVLMDIQMPVLDGVAACRAIRALPGAVADMPILAMTANVMPEQLASYQQAGMDDAVAKPVDPSALDAAIARAMVGRPVGRRPAALPAPNSVLC